MYKKAFLIVKWTVLALLAPFAVGYFLLTVVTFVLGDPQAMVDFPILLSAIVVAIMFKRWLRPLKNRWDERTNTKHTIK